MSTVMTDGAGTIRIVLGGGGTARLFGVPFFLVGAWLGYHLILGLFQLVTGTSGVEMIPGTILLLIMTAAFLLPGWALLVARAVVEIDRARGIVYGRARSPVLPASARAQAVGVLDDRGGSPVDGAEQAQPPRVSGRAHRRVQDRTR